MADETQAERRSPEQEPSSPFPRDAADRAAVPYVIGGSSAAAILGQDQYRTPLTLDAEMLGIIPRHADNEAMYWGRELEDKILKRYAMLQQTTVVCRALEGDDETFGVWHPRGTHSLVTRNGDHIYNEAIALLDLEHPELPWMRGHPDGYAGRANGSRFNIELGVEAKMGSVYQEQHWGDPGTDEIPERYLPQPHHYQTILRDQAGLDLAWEVAALLGQRFRIHRVEPDHEMGALLKEREAEFVRRLVERDPPRAGLGDTQTLVALFPDSVSGEIVDVEPGSWWEDLALAYAVAHVRTKRAEAEKELAQVHLHEAMEETEGLRGAGWSYSWKVPTAKPKTDWREAFMQLRQVYVLRHKQGTPEAIAALDAAEAAREDNTSTPELKRRAYPSRMATLAERLSPEGED